MRLELKHITLIRDQRPILRDLSLSVGEGEILCLLGPSGCGKTSLLRVAAGITRQDEGEVLIDGELVAGPGGFAPPEARKIGMMFQDFALFPHLNARQNAAFSGAEPGRVNELLERVGLIDRASNYPHELSGGEQQRLALARALAARPRILLMDEPFSGLDDRLRVAVRGACLSLLEELGTSVILVTHDPAEAMHIGDRISLMREGEIVQTGAPYHIYNNPVDRESAGFFGEINVISGIVEGGMADTPFGPFLTPACEEGERVEFVIRPQHFKIDFDRAGKGPRPTRSDGVPARGRVVKARFLGRESLVEFVMDFEDTKLLASVPAVFLPPQGQEFWLSVRRDRVHMFRLPPNGGN